MSISIELRFSKADKYGNHVFICSKKNPDEAKAMEQLNIIHDKMEDLETTGFLPIYKADTYTTVRIRKTDAKFVANAVYMIVFSIHKFVKETTTFACMLSKSKLIKKAPEVDMGELMEF